MGTLVGIIKRGADALQTVVTITSLEGPLARTGYTQSKVEIRQSTSVDGEFSFELDAGNYKIEWDAGKTHNLGYFAMPDDADEHNLEDLITTTPDEPIDPDVSGLIAAANAAALLSRVKVYDTLAALLAATATSWTFAMTANYSGTDGVRHLWVKILVADSPYTPDGAAVCLTDDTLAHAVRFPS